MADRVRGDGVATTGYDPTNRPNAMQTKYMVSTTGDRWFIPYNSEGTTAAQLAQCKKQVGGTVDDSDAGVQVVV